MDKPKLLIPRDCPLCGKIIYVFDKHNRPVSLNNNGTHFWVRANDASVMEFAICKDCLLTLDKKRVDFIMDSQIYTWGQEIINNPLSIISLAKQLSWYVNKAVLLRVEKFGINRESV